MSYNTKDLTRRSETSAYKLHMSNSDSVREMYSMKPTKPLHNACRCTVDYSRQLITCRCGKSERLAGNFPTEEITEQIEKFKKHKCTIHK
jgi:hypothetical protein